MNTKKAQQKVLFSLIFMYFIAPQIWGIWMVLKLNIITFTQYLHVALSPVTLVLMGVFFYLNYRYYTKFIYKFSSIESSNIPKNTHKVPVFHLISIIIFGTVATFLAMLTLYFPKLGFFVTSSIELNTLITGMLSGTSLVFIFFFLFTSIIIRTFDLLLATNNSTLTPKIFYRYLPLNLVLMICGFFLMIISTVKSLEITGSEMGNAEFINRMNISMFTLIIPFTFGSLLLVSQVKLNNK